MNIAEVYSGPLKGGAIATIVNRLASNYQPSILICPFVEDGDRNEILRTLESEVVFFRSIKSFIHAIRKIRSFAPTVLLAHAPRDLMWSFLLRSFLRNRKRISVICVVHSEEPLSRTVLRPVLNLLLPILNQRCKAHLVVSDSVQARNSVLTLGSVKVILVPQVIDVDILGRPEAISEAPRFIAAGRMVESKNFLTLLKGVEKAQNHLRSVGAIVEVFGDGPLLQDLNDLSEELSIDDIIRFPGHVTNLSDRLLSAHYALMPSNLEASSMFLIEALLSGCIVATGPVGDSKISILKYGDVEDTVFANVPSSDDWSGWFIERLDQESPSYHYRFHKAVSARSKVRKEARLSNFYSIVTQV